MSLKFLSTVYSIYRNAVTPRDYHIISEQLEYKIDYDIKYQVEDTFWEDESKDWDGILEEFYVNVTGKNFRSTTIPQNVMYTVLRVKYYFNGKVYTAISNDINFKPGEVEERGVTFSIPLSSAWIVDQGDKPVRNITEKVKRYAGPRCNFHGEKVPLEYFLYYEKSVLTDKFPRIVITNSLGMKKTLSTTEDFTTDLQIP
jgi:hypothetical protein